VAGILQKRNKIQTVLKKEEMIWGKRTVIQQRKYKALHIGRDNQLFKHHIGNNWH